MWKIAAWMILAVACICAQVYQDLLLPEARHMVAVVVDQEGKPVVDARIDHTAGDPYKAYQTDSEGKFELNTRARVLVVRKMGFRSEVVRTQKLTGAPITLQKLSEDRIFPSCSRSGQYEGLDGAEFQFQINPAVKLSPRVVDSDYVLRDYYVETPQGPKGIMHGSGGAWSIGTPEDRDVWRSVEYEETMYGSGNGRMIVDARGQFLNGNRWRSLGMSGESASYSEVGQATAKILDRFLDTACLKPTPH